MEYSIELKAEALANLSRLPTLMQERILKKVNWMKDNFELVTPQPLTGDLSGLFKLRSGDYRVLYSFNNESKIITIHRIGHRRDVYD